MNKILVYTVVTNDKELPKIPCELGADYYCFTNNSNLQVEDWKVKYIEEDSLSDFMFIQKYKILGDKNIEDSYDIIVYIEQNLSITSLENIIQNKCDFEQNKIYFLKSLEQSTDQVVYKLLQSKKNNATVIRTQMDYYQRQNFPSNIEFITDQFIIRKNEKNENLLKLQQEWYHQVEQFQTPTYLSLMYCLWKLQINYGVIQDSSIEINIGETDDMNVFGNGFSNCLGLEEEKNKYEPKKNDYHCHIDDINDSHSTIARRVREGSTVLDIGCGTGIIGKLLKENKNCVNYGIEIDEKSAEIAQNSTYYKKVFHISIENAEERKQIEKEKITFDYIILADVLEHMQNPTEILYQVSKWLSSNGKILVSVPNIAYADIIKGLINEEFNYQKTGILDSTHLHFFTKKSFIEMIANFRITYQVNFDVEWLDSTKYKVKESILENILNEEKYSIVQNIYELSKLKDGEIPMKMLETLNEPKENTYQKIVHYVEMEKQNRETIDQLRKINKTLENEIGAIIQSKSWKITKPLRKISKTINRS